MRAYSQGVRNCLEEMVPIPKLVQVASAAALTIVVAVLAWVVFDPRLLTVESTKVCQVTGTEDRQHPDRPTGATLTGRTGGITGTDLGFPFEYKGELVMLFGDSREFDPDRCEPFYCGTDDLSREVLDKFSDNSHGGLKRWPTQAAWDAWVAHRTEGADSIAKAPLNFDAERCIPVSVETDEIGSVYVHELSPGRIDVPFRLSGAPVASRPEDRWVIVSGQRLLVITQSGEVFAHDINVTSRTVGSPSRLGGPHVAARHGDKWVAAMGDRLLVGTDDGRVFAHPITPSAILPAIQLSGARVAASADDKWVLVAGNRLLVVTTDGRVFAHPITGNVIGVPFRLGGSRVAANPQDKWVLATDNQLLVITRGGELFVHLLTGNDVGAAPLVNSPWAFVGANPQDRRVLVMGNRLLILTQQDGLFRPTTLDGEVVGRDEGAIAAVTDDAALYAFFTMKHAGHSHADDEPGGRTVLARSLDDGRSFYSLVTTSTIGKFLWTVPVLARAADVRGLPGAGDVPELSVPNANVVLMWGAGRQDRKGHVTPFLHSFPFLAVAPFSSLEDLSSWRYYAGSDARGAARWSPNESEAQPVLPFGASRLDRSDGPGYHECLGYFSVRRMEAWGRWVMVYACDNTADSGYNPDNGTRGIYMRTAQAPWGPWSPPQLVFDPKIGSGYCEFMHYPRPGCEEGSPNPVEESVRLVGKKADIGVIANTRAFAGEYAPILLPSRYVKITPDATTLYFVMGTWNPYQVVLMRTKVERVSLSSVGLRLDRLAILMRGGDPSASGIISDRVFLRAFGPAAEHPRPVVLQPAGIHDDST